MPAGEQAASADPLQDTASGAEQVKPCGATEAAPPAAGRLDTLEQQDDGQQEAASSDDEAFGAAGPAYADEAPACQQRHGDSSGGATSSVQQPFNDEAWELGQRFRKPAAAQRSDAAVAEAAGPEAGSDADAQGQPSEADKAPAEEVLTPEQIEVCCGLVTCIRDLDRIRT